MKLIKKIKAPSFKLKCTNDEVVDLKSIKSSYIVLYFYPKDDTPGCTIETNDFNKLLKKFKKLDCEVYGISKDDIKSHKKFKTKYKINFDLLADEKKKMIKSYKVWKKKEVFGHRIYGYCKNYFSIR